MYYDVYANMSSVFFKIFNKVIIFKIAALSQRLQTGVA